MLAAMRSLRAKTVSAVEMRFLHPDTNQEKVIRYADLALTVERGALPDEVETDAVTDAVDPDPEEEGSPVQTDGHQELRANDIDEYVPLGNALVKRLSSSAARLPPAPGQP